MSALCQPLESVLASGCEAVRQSSARVFKHVQGVLSSSVSRKRHNHWELKQGYDIAAFPLFLLPELLTVTLPSCMLGKSLEKQALPKCFKYQSSIHKATERMGISKFVLFADWKLAVSHSTILSMSEQSKPARKQANNTKHLDFSARLLAKSLLRTLCKFNSRNMVTKPLPRAKE